MPRSENNTETSGPEPSNRNTERTVVSVADGEPNHGGDGCTENNGTRIANNSNYLSDHMSPNTDVEQQRSTDGGTSGSVERGRQS
jgi:hypothetical protein